MEERTYGEMALLLRNLDDAYGGKAWHGPTLRGSIRGVSARQAVWRPRAKRHNIAEIVLHAAYWKYAARRRLRGDKRGSFPLKGSDWFVVPASLTEKTWRQYVSLLETEHRILREAVAALPSAQLHRPPRGSKVENAKLIYGIAAHDVYHTGQIRLLKSMYGSML
ncbi:MAG: DinB family protein [Phycisphaerae bacterium]|nr:DinB family protein [Phycisphaerae bacterium]